MVCINMCIIGDIRDGMWRKKTYILLFILIITPTKHEWSQYKATSHLHFFLYQENDWNTRTKLGGVDIISLI